MIARRTLAFPGNRASIFARAALWFVLAIPGAASAAPLTLQAMFDGNDFTQDGLAFSAFTPALSTSLPSAQDIDTLIKTDPLALFDIQLLDFQAGQFSASWGNAQDAVADNITLEILPDDSATSGVDPGFKLNSASEWTVDAGGSTPGDTGDDVASAQLSAFAYTVESTNTQPINSAGIKQLSMIDAIGPDVLSLFPFELPDVAAAFALQVILDSSNNTLAQNLTLRGGVRLSSSAVLPLSQLELWSTFTDQTSVRVVNVIGVGASSGGGFTLQALEQRIDPPAPMPLPGTLVLIVTGLAAIRLRLGQCSLQRI